MRKIGILTFHLSENHGSALQAFALQQTIEEIIPDAEVLIINYRTTANKAVYDVISPYHGAKENIYNLLHVRSLYQRKRKFHEFQSSYLKTYPTQTLNEDSIASVVKEFDTIVAGSDQIWGYPGVKDSSLVYFLNMEGNFKRIAYAPSMGKLAQFDSDEALDLIKRFDSVSARESDEAQFLLSKGISAEHLVDPSLFLDKAKWSALIGEPLIKGDYIFYYSIGCKWHSFSVAKKLEKEVGLPVAHIGTYPKDIASDFIKKRDAGPLDFLNLVYYSKLVCSDSFHGTAFALNFKKPLAAVFEANSNGEMVIENRKYSILEKIGATQYACSPNTDFGTFIPSIMDKHDFPLLEEHIAHSHKWLENALR